MSELTNNIIDQLLFLQDVLNIQVQVVEEYLKNLLMSDFFVKYCYQVIDSAAKHVMDTSPVTLQWVCNPRTAFRSDRRCFSYAVCSTR